MKSARRGTPASQIEIANVTIHGFWLFFDGRETFLAFDNFPWFRSASIARLCNVKHPHPHHLHWPDLDIDLAVESIMQPTKHPLVSRIASPRKQRKTVTTRDAGKDPRKPKTRPIPGHSKSTSP